ncbi:MAG TPA: asparaginase [Planctomycetota bacterium]|nr:asparaginase [Planctomycetota bacterium]
MASRTYPENPVLLDLRRGGSVESRHRGAWVAVREGEVVAARGDVEHGYFARSAAKPFQALPWIESGAADRFGARGEEIALSVGSHNGEDHHARVAASLLARGGFEERDLRCGAHASLDPGVASALAAAGTAPHPLRHNCSGKHAAMLHLARHLGDDPARYLEPGSRAQRSIRETAAQMCGIDPEAVAWAVDGCSAPTLVLPLRAVALGYARLTTPDGLPPSRKEACERIARSVAEHPEMLGGRNRLDTALSRASRGRLFPKVGAEGFQAVGVAGEASGFALKVDDGSSRALAPLLLALLRSLGWLRAEEVESLGPLADTVLRSHAGLPVGEVEVRM